MARCELLRREEGISSVEFAIVCSVFFLFIFSIVDFSRALWEWNGAAKATHMGVRYAVVNDPVSAAVDYDGIANGIGNGQAIEIVDFNGGKPIICKRPAGETLCQLDKTVETANDAAFMAIVRRMQATYGGILPEHVIVEYRHVGLGFSGNPYGSDIIPTVTIRLQLPDFILVTPGLSQIFSIPRPDYAATLTAEDHENT